MLFAGSDFPKSLQAGRWDLHALGGHLAPRPAIHAVRRRGREHEPATLIIRRDGDSLVVLPPEMQTASTR